MSDLEGAIRTFRRVARQVVRDPDLSEDGRVLAVARIADCLVGTHELVREAVWREVQAFLGHPEPPPHELPGDPVERRLAAMSRQGRVACPACLRPVPSRRELARWADLRRREIERLAREEAV
jgi:hypothetical protein